MFSEKDKKQIDAKGADIKTIKKQISEFVHGFPYIDLAAPATPGEGIRKIAAADATQMATFFDKKMGDCRVVKFVPASGAASRMFSHLFAFMDKYTGTESDHKIYLSETGFNSAFHFFSEIERFAFYDDLEQCLAKKRESIQSLTEHRKLNTILEQLLTAKGLNYAGLPKALLKFHKYDNHARTAAEEHLVEGANYCKSSDGKVLIHFTLSPEHIESFKALLDGVVGRYEQMFNVTFEISWSVQKSSTDTIAVDADNKPFREADGSLLFRPGGHGALISNLNEVDADIVFIKNIDNVVPDSLKEQTFLFKKVIGGCLLHLREQVFDYIRLLENAAITDEKLIEIKHFLKKEFFVDLESEFYRLKSKERIKLLHSKLNRPIRVCGMVKNEGEPGGGPFLVRSPQGEVSLQIVESSQIHLKDPLQREIFMKATHFNPVDLVCSLTAHDGKKFDLHKFIDPETGFISHKTKDGKPLKALELPGLWNGAMSNWNTVFVEVPIITFNPVKTVNDLLRKEHQS
ncbi:MAG: DUF4301 family protein [Bacteroidota bacterium]